MRRRSSCLLLVAGPRSARAAETDLVVAGGRAAVTGRARPGGPHRAGAGIGGAAAGNTVGNLVAILAAVIGAIRIGNRDARGPFVHVAGEVEHAVRRRAVGKRSDRTCLA